MSSNVKFDLIPETIDHGSIEERCTAGRFELIVDGKSLTSGLDIHTGATCAGPVVSGYHLAEWLLWNYWRHLSEPEVTTHTDDDDSFDWHLSHCMTSIGYGYDWPNITLVTDGPSTWFKCQEPSTDCSSSFKYETVGEYSVVSEEFERVVIEFVEKIVARLDAVKGLDSNLQRLMADVKRERSDPFIRRYRQIEAILGFDPDQLPEDQITAFVESAEEFGEHALFEIAAHYAAQGLDENQLPDAESLWILATGGLEIQQHNEAPTNRDIWSQSFDFGTEGLQQVSLLASMLREEMSVEANKPISSRALADFWGTSHDFARKAFPTSNQLGFSFALDEPNGIAVFLSSKSEMGRRIELVRLMFERIASGLGPLVVATESETYRQELQKAFAAELLSPIGAIQAFFRDDYSEHKIREAADFFKVSRATIHWQLRRHMPFLAESPTVKST